ncbi:CocE/NonD family hydrolase [Lacticaseibacillus nasuensis]|uniref:CocE/NonD family hydrolase n=1 Tax=Lacticaseibacillus nasuensis TaxID=944671 RepID=UPI0022487179|nr:CocE/NonD family hydrolase [Lacticaseibacillus nasuensis]MCX2455165.1 CocE/NonD family hydrolase [Lacticaseibacillus nasuensis]
MTDYAFYQSGVREAQFRVTAGQAELTWTAGGTGALDWAALSAWARLPLEPWLTTIAGATVPSGASFTWHERQYARTADPHLIINREARPAINLIVDHDVVVGCQHTGHSQTTVVIAVGKEQLSSLRYWQAAGLLLTDPAPLPAEQTAMVPMTDGVQLATSLQLPAGAGPVATVFMRTPYGRGLYTQNLVHFAQRGFAVAIQDVRGRNDSQGEWLPMYHEEGDGAAALAWLAAQPWSTGKIGMYGGSYSGGVQWMAAASRSPYLAAMISEVTSGSSFDDMFYRRGAPLSALASWLFATDERYFDPSKMTRQDWTKLLKIRPLKQIPVVGLGHEIPGFTTITAHPDDDDWHAVMDWPARAAGITVPVLIQSGWYDDDGIGTTAALNVTKDYPAGRRKVILGAWLHGGNAQYDLGPIHLGEQAVRFDLDVLHQRFFDHWLNGIDNGVDREPTVEYDVVHQAHWRTAASFPPAGTTQRWALDATTASFGPTAPQTAGHADFDYDPADPTPQLLDVSANEFEYPNDYATVEQRGDVVSFTSAPLTAGLTVAGWFDVDFDAISSAVNTDWVVRLTDVTPTGESLNMADGVMNARYRNGNTPVPLTPGEPAHYHLQTQKTAYYLAPGHRLRLDIASAAANLIFPNTNTAAGPYAPAESGVVAHQQILTGPGHDSHVTFTQIDN